nr:unnamed protein product [Digitaria exilis]
MEAGGASGPRHATPLGAHDDGGRGRADDTEVAFAADPLLRAPGIDCDGEDSGCDDR